MDTLATVHRIPIIKPSINNRILLLFLIQGEKISLFLYGDYFLETLKLSILKIYSVDRWIFLKHEMCININIRTIFPLR